MDRPPQGQNIPLSSSVPLETIVGAVASAVRHSLTSTDGGQPSSSQPLQATQEHPQTTFERACNPSHVPKRPKFTPPSLYRGRKRGAKPERSKITSYMRDVVLLPPEFKAKNGEIIIPRSSNRVNLGKAGLVGKIEIDSGMSDMDVRREICQVFATSMGLTMEDVKQNRVFPFSYLQRTGQGSKGLCVPSVKEGFEWNGKRVASLAKAGSVIYLLAQEEVFGWKQVVKRECIEVLSSDDEAVDCECDDLPDVSFLTSGDNQSIESSSLQSESTSARSSLLLSPASKSLMFSTQTSSLSQPSLLSTQALSFSPPSASTHVPSSLTQPSGSSTKTLSSPSQLSASSTQAPSSLLQPSASSLPRPSALSTQTPSFTPELLSSSSPSGLISESSAECMDLPHVSSDYSTLGDVQTVMSVFGDKFSRQQVSLILRLAEYDVDAAIECLCSGPTLTSILKLLANSFVGKKHSKVYIDSNDMWLDLVGLYKAGNLDFGRPIRVSLDDSTAIDTGGVRRDVFTEVFLAFAENRQLVLFQGMPNYLRPINSIEIMSTGIMKVLGQMIAHSIAMDGIGFPYFSPICYWYLIGGIDKAIPFIGKDDVSTAVYTVIEKIGELESEADVTDLLSEEYVIDTLQLCGVTTQLTVLTKCQVAQSLYMADALYGIKPVLDSLAEGLKACGILKLIRAFPDIFVSLFVSTGDMSNEDVLEAVYTEENDASQDPSIQHLTSFIASLDKKGISSFVKHVTGQLKVGKRSIKVAVLDDDRGAITAHVCANTITLPRGVFDTSQQSYDLFVSSMNAILLSSKSFNTV